MTTAIKATAIALTLFAATAAFTGAASASPDDQYHWAYPDKYKG